MGINYGNKNDEFKFKTKRNPIDCQTGRSASGPIHVVNPGATMFASKKAIHSFGLLHQAVHGVFIGDFEKGDGTTEEKILLSRRGEQKVQWPGYWDITVGEHMEESAVAPLDALKNAVNKELGITLEKRIARFTIRDTINYKTKTKTGEIIDKTDDEFRHVFVIRTDKLNNNNEIEPKDKGDTSEYKWFTKSEFDELLKSEDEKDRIVRYKYFEGSEKFTNFSDFFIAKTLEIRDELKVYLSELEGEER